MIGRSGDLRCSCMLGSPLLLLRVRRPLSELLLLLLRALRLGSICLPLLLLLLLLLLLPLLLSRRMRSPLVRRISRDNLAIVLLSVILFSVGGDDFRCPPVAVRIPRAASASPDNVLRRGEGGKSMAGSVLKSPFIVGLRPTGGGGRAEYGSYASSSFKVVTRRT